MRHAGGSDAQGGRHAAMKVGGKGKSKKGAAMDEADEAEARERARIEALAIDWDAIARALPLGADEEDIVRRNELFAKWDVNSNGGLSFTEVDGAMKKLMAGLTPRLVGKGKGALFEWSRSWKPVIMRAFIKSQNFNAQRKAKAKRNDDYVERDEFRMLLVCVRLYFEMFIAFSRVDVNVDRKIDIEEFKNSVPELRKWGIELAPDQVVAEFEAVDIDHSGAVMFEEFICWALEKKLDLEDDDDDLAGVYMSEMTGGAAGSVFL